MTNYETIALKSAQLCITDKTKNPREAWFEVAKEVFPNKKPSQKKSCPKNTFLGLCETGVIKGIPHGEYLVRPSIHKVYAIKAVNALKTNPDLKNDKNELWKLACGDGTKAKNSEMDIVILFFEKKMLDMSIVPIQIK